MHYTATEITQKLCEALSELKKFRDTPIPDSQMNLLANIMYTPQIELKDLLKKIIEEVKLRDSTKSRSTVKTKNIEIGNLLEQIAIVAMKGLNGISSLKSFQSAGPQYDLIVSGDDVEWTSICEILFSKIIGSPSILVEAKAQKNPLQDKQLARVCSLLDTCLPKTTFMGIFFTIKGASGLSDKGGKRKRVLRDCALLQALYYAKSEKPIIIFDLDDIQALVKSGSLITLLRRKIREIEHLSGLPAISPTIAIETDLPAHLKLYAMRASGP